MTPASAVFAAGMLAGRSALITGGGTGLGKAAAQELVDCGAEVWLAGRRDEVLAAAAEEVGAAGWVSGDVRDAEGCAAIAAAVPAALDVLVNNAGGQYFVPAEAITARGWQAVSRLNVGGTWGMTQALLPRLREHGGTVLNVTLSPHHGMAGMAHSSVARAAVEGLTREWAADFPELAVVAVAAGHFETEAIGKYPDVVRQGAARSVPLQRLGRPEEHAWLVALLCSPLGRRFSGQTVTLDGARDNWFGPWPPPTLVGEQGEVPTEERRPR